MDYAIVHAGGRQYRLSPGDVVDVDRMEGEPGSIVELPNVVLLSRQGEVIVGTPTVPGARVVAEVERHLRGDKLTVFKYKAKTRFRRKTGHRQEYTRLRVTEIAAP